MTEGCVAEFVHQWIKDLRATETPVFTVQHDLEEGIEVCAVYLRVDN